MKLFVPIIAVAMAFATACANDATSPSVSIQGTWTLRTLNGQSLPVQLNNGAAVTYEQRTLNSDGTYTDVVFFSSGNSSNEFGSYSVNGNSITFDDQTDNFSYTGSISGNVLTAFDGSFTAVYQKS